MTAEHSRPPPIQFSLRTLLAITAAVALLFGTLRWLEVSPRASLIVLIVLVVGVLAAVGLVVVIARSLAGEVEEEETAPSPKKDRDPPPSSGG